MRHVETLRTALQSAQGMGGEEREGGHRDRGAELETGSQQPLNGVESGGGQFAKEVELGNLSRLR